MKNKRQPRSRDGGERDLVSTTVHPVEWAVEAGAVNDVLQEMDARLRRRRRVRASSGAVVMLLLAALVWHRAEPGANVGESASSSAVVSLPERQVLTDGSIVELKHGAQIDVAFTDVVRRVILSRGEAHFQVAKQTTPFVVAVRGVEVRAVGTAFSVQLGGAEVEVVVTEGVVAVGQTSKPAVSSADHLITPAAVPQNAVALVEAGNRILMPAAVDPDVHARPAVVPMAAAEMAVRLAWRAPRLEFSRTPLTQALALMNQHAAPGNAMTVKYADRSLGRVEVSGVLRADNMETLLRLLEEEHGIRTEYLSPRDVLLRKPN